MKIVRTAPHEFDANLNFEEYGLDPFFAADSRIKEGGGSVSGRFKSGGDIWGAQLSYQDTGIVHPGEETPQGTPFRIETIREYRLRVKLSEDRTGEKKFTAHLRPRWKGMEAERKDGSTVEIPVPFLEGVNLRVQGSNIEFDRYHDLLKGAMNSLDINPKYFEEIHGSSNIQDAERYVRLHRDQSGPIHARDGPIWALGHVLENDRDGYRKIVQNDRDEHSKNLPGYYHTVTLDARRVQEAWPDHRLPKEIKHYYAREAHDRDGSDPLAHPKLGASYQSSQDTETFHFSEENLETLNRELEETVHSVLQAAGIDTSPGAGKPPEDRGTGVFVEDSYFDVELVDRPNPSIIDVAQVKQNQENIVIKYLADGISPVQREALRTLVTDGGQVSPKDISEENDRHLGSVYRALRELDELVERSYGEVALRSDHVAEMVHESLQEARDAYGRSARTMAKVKEAADKQYGEAMEKFVAWAERHGVDYRRDRAEQLEIEFPEDTHFKMKDGRLSGEIARLIRIGYDYWTQAGQDPAVFRTADIEIRNRNVQGLLVGRALR